MIALACAFAMLLPAAQHSAAPHWTTVAPPGTGFSIEAPGPAARDPRKPSRYSVDLDDAAFIVDVDELDAGMREAVTSGDRKRIEAYLETLRDGTIEGMKAARRSNSDASFDGHPSLFFTFDGTLGDARFESTQRIVLTETRLYSVLAIGSVGKLRQADVDRFHQSFRLVSAPAPPADGGVRTISYAEANCDKLPPVPLRFEVPTDFVARAPTRSIESGCLWGTKADLDRATADPAHGDFSNLSRGVFHARVSTNIVNDPQTGGFDAMDGAGEAGIRRQLEGAGATAVVWKKLTLGGLPALEIVADLGPDRVYMLYLGNTRYNSNAILVNYYHPTPRTPEDDRVWARFIAGVKADR